MNTPLYTAFTRPVIGALLACLLLSCQAPPAKPTSRVSKAKPDVSYSASDYVYHLALAQLAPENNAGSLDIINEYAGQKVKKPEYQRVVIASYKTLNSNGLQQLIVPVSQDQPEFPYLLDVISQITGTKYVLHDLDLATARVKSGKSLQVAANNPNIQETLLGHQQRLLENSKKLPVLEDIKMQLELVPFFTRYRLRDAAYLTVDNIKQLLASLPQDEKEAEIIEIYSNRLNNLESDLRKAMPFTL